MFYLNETSAEELTLFWGCKVKRKNMGSVHKIVSTCYGHFVTFEVPQLMHDPGLVLESETVIE